MTDEQLQTILVAIADVQVAVDAAGLDIQAIMERLDIGGTAEDDDPTPPGWVSGRE